MNRLRRWWHRRTHWLGSCPMCGRFVEIRIFDRTVPEHRALSAKPGDRSSCTGGGLEANR